MNHIEIPHEKERKFHYRFFEILPGALSWTLLFMPLILSLINVELAVFVILAYMLVYFVRSIAYTIRAISGYRTMKQFMKLNWPLLNLDLESETITDQKGVRPDWHLANLNRLR